jgi:hypothetical protein
MLGIILAHFHGVGVDVVKGHSVLMRVFKRVSFEVDPYLQREGLLRLYYKWQLLFNGLLLFFRLIALRLPWLVFADLISVGKIYIRSF